MSSFDKIVKLGKEAAVYGLSSIIGRFLNFLLVPLYTNFLVTSEYGIIATLYSYLAFVQILFGYGMDSAYMRYFGSKEFENPKQLFSTPFVSLIASSLCLSLSIYIFADELAIIAGLTPNQTDLVKLAAWIPFWDCLTLVPFSVLRMEHKAFRFASLRVLNILFNIALTVFFLVFLKMRAEGVLLANLLASALTFFSLLPVVFRKITIHFNKKLFWELFKFGIPLVPAGIAGIAMQVIDRPILKMLTDDATVGIYQANYRLGIFMMLVVGMFDYAWRPFFLEHAEEPDAKTLFSKVFTYLFTLMCFLFLMVSFFIDDLVRLSFFGKHFIHEAYWSGLNIVPWVLIAYIFLGAYVNFGIGVYIKKKTKYLPYITGIGALINVGANFILIPRYDILGAALATLLSYMIMAVGMYFASRKLYFVSYEWKKISLISVFAIGLFLFYNFFTFIPHEFFSLLAKFSLLCSFILLIILAGVIEPRQLKQIKESFSELLGRR